MDIKSYSLVKLCLFLFPTISCAANYSDVDRFQNKKGRFNIYFPYATINTLSKNNLIEDNFGGLLDGEHPGGSAECLPGTFLLGRDCHMVKLINNIRFHDFLTIDIRFLIYNSYGGTLNPLRSFASCCMQYQTTTGGSAQF